MSLLRGVGGGGEWSSEQDGIVLYISGWCAFLPPPVMDGLWSSMGPVVMLGDQPAWVGADPGGGACCWDTTNCDGRGGPPRNTK